MLNSRLPAVRSEGLEALEQLKSRAVLNVRAKQGEALYYAAEAYQTRGTIAHVVGEMQKLGKKVIPEDVINGVRRETDLSRDEYVNSYYENGANLIKELNDKKVIDEAGNVVSDSKKLGKAAIKASKYFVRQIDAAHMSGVKFTDSGIPEVEKLVEATVELEKARGEPEAFHALLKEYGWTPEEFLNRVLEANRGLDSHVVKQGSLTEFAAELNRAGSAAEETALKQAGALKLNVLVSLPKNFRNLDSVEQLRRHFTSRNGRRLVELHRAEASGRILTEAQRSELNRLRRIAKAQNTLEYAAAFAKAGAIDPGEIKRTIEENRKNQTDPVTSRLNAATSLREKTRKKLKKRNGSTWKDASGNVPAGSVSKTLREDLELPDAQDATPEKLTEMLKSADRYIQNTEGAVGPDTLKHHIEGGRIVLALIELPERTKPSWIRVLNVEGKEIHLQDPESGTDTTVSLELFQLISRDQSELLIVDPFRTANGTLRNTRSVSPNRNSLNLDSALPLPGTRR